MKERLQKVLAEYGIASRRKCEQLIIEGKVKVNGIFVTELGTKVDKFCDEIELDGNILKKLDKKVYVLLNKPVGYITSVKDQFDRPVVTDLIKNLKVRIYPVGRLDYDTEGLLILTNDGDLAYKITHPKHQMNKKYVALVSGVVQEENIEKFKSGILIDDYKTAPAILEILKKTKDNSLIKITIHEGKNRQVRKMCEAIGHKVIHLKRISIGNIILGELASGEYRFLTEKEVTYLKTL